VSSRGPGAARARRSRRGSPPPWTLRRIEELDADQRVAFEIRRERVAAAAEVLIGERGTGVTMAEVAAAAGVGMSTVYRTFASKDELLDLLARRRAERSAEVWRRTHRHGDARAALIDAVWAFAELGVTDTHDAVPAGTSTARPAPRAPSGAAPAARADADAGERALARARAAGLRDGIDLDDVVRAAQLVGALPRDGDDGARRRLVAIYVDGLFAQGAGPLPVVGH